jgi:signal transduction histidine kinase/DNA-binding response OmpR family regulator/HAMP domain-containing protein
MRFTFRTKLIAIVAINALALIVLILSSSLLSRRVDLHLGVIQEQYLPKVGLRPHLKRQFERIGRGLQDAVAAADRDLLSSTREVEQALLAQLDAAASALEPRNAAALAAAVEDYYAAAYRLSGRLIDGETGEAIVHEVEAMQARQDRARELIERVSAFDEGALAEEFAAAASAQRTAGSLRLAISAVCLLAVLLLSLWVWRAVFRSLGGLTAGFQRFGEGDFATPIPVASRDELGELAAQANDMSERLQLLISERDRSDWLKSGSAGLAAELQGELELEEVADRAVRFVAGAVGAPVGALYLADGDGLLRLLGKYGLASDAPRWTALGEGLAGEAAHGSDLVVLDAPSGGLRVTSAMIEGEPRAVALLPLHSAGKLTGVLELATLEPWKDRSSELLRSVRDMLAIAIEVARGRSATRELLAETQRQAERLAIKEDQLRRSNQELSAASAYKSQFLANMSHELRTPLNGILGFAELLHDGVVSPDEPQHQEFLGDILTSGRHLLRLINDVLDLARVEAGKLEIRAEPVDLEAVTGEVLAILRTTAADKRIAIDSRVDPSLDDLVLDPSRLKQILYNYVSNAIRFTPEGGKVSIRAIPDKGDAVRIEVEDTGIGIAAKDQGRLFTEFQQIGTAARSEGGTGLGLALTKKLVEAQGGRVGVESEPDAGSVFFAVLPRRSAADAAAPPPRPPIARPGAAAVLVIEDNAGDQSVLADALSAAGYAVEIAGTGGQALAALRARRFDAITLDLLLPDISGLDVLAQLRDEESHAGVPVIVVTVVAERGAVAGFAVADVLPKPLDPAALLAALSRAGVPPGRKSGPVLVLDDDPGSLKLMAATLHQLGLDAICESHGADALQAVRDRPPRAVILDLMMPGMNGFEFLERLRSEPAGRRVPVIVWTIKDLSAAEQATLRASADAVVAKGDGAAAAVIAELELFLGEAEAAR